MSENIREGIANLEHDQWKTWSYTIAQQEEISPDRLERWKQCWIPYQQLPEDVKEHDRKWADQILSFLKSQIEQMGLAKPPTRSYPVHIDWRDGQKALLKDILALFSEK